MKIGAGGCEAACKEALCRKLSPSVIGGVINSIVSRFYLSVDNFQ
jgi:hypothetical protein